MPSQKCTIESLAQGINNSLHKSFFIMHLNIRSLQRNFHKLQDLLCEIKNSPDLIALSEIWQNTFFIPSLPNYEFVQSSFSCNRAGGVAFFLNKKYNYKIRQDISLSTHKCEDLWLEIKAVNERTVIMGVIYVHPGCKLQHFEDSFKKLIFNLNKSNKPVFLMGDFNINYAEGSNSCYKKSVLSLGYHQYVNTPTHYNIRNNSSSIIDHFYSNQPKTSITVKVLTHDLTDHLPVLAWIKKPRLEKSKMKTVVRRNMKHFDSDSFITDLSHELGLIDLNKGNEINQIYNSFINTLMKVIDRHAPCVKLTRREIKLKHKPWVTKDVRKIIKQKNKFYRKSLKTGNPEDIKTYKKLSNSVIKLKEQLKRRHYDNVVKKSSKNSKLTWKTINDIVNLKQNKGAEIRIIEDTNGVEVSDPVKISNIFNKYFVGIGEKLASSFPTQDDIHPNLFSPKDSFKLKPITVYEVSNHIKNMDATKSVRPSDPPIKFLKIACPVIAPLITQIFNLCIQQGVYPDDMKHGCVIPIFKKGEKQKCGNHRPICLTSPFSKVFEKCILSQLESFFSCHNILTDKQYGFKIKHFHGNGTLSCVRIIYTKL